MHEYHLADFGARAVDGSDTTLAVRAALDAARGQSNVSLVFAPGRYDFFPDRAFERYEWVSNHDPTLKRIVFLLEHHDDITIEGQGAQFVFHGFVTPFALADCRNIRLCNFTVDWARTFHSEAQVLAAHGEADGMGTVDLRLPEAYPFRIEHGRLILSGEGDDTYRLGYALEFDPLRRETAFRVSDNWALSTWHRAESLGSHDIRLQARFATLPTVGNVLALIDGRRFCPAISARECTNLAVENISLYHCGGMGLIAQRCRDVKVRRLDVLPAPGSGRIISITADATHFVNCAGHIEMEHCRFENQLDDATNVHGIYVPITQLLSENEVEVKLAHPQQAGVDFAAPSETVGFVRNDTLATYHTARVADVERLNSTYTRLRFDTPLPPDVQIGHALENQTWNPDVTIRHCVARGNRARGFLISTPGQVRIEHNRFHIPGAAILIAGDANYWFESGAVRDVAIRDNDFGNCLYGVWGRAVIDINPEIEPTYRAEPRYHRNITIEDNRFVAFDQRLLRAQAVDGLTVRGNQIIPSDAYPAQPIPQTPFQVDDGTNVRRENNGDLPEVPAPDA